MSLPKERVTQLVPPSSGTGPSPDADLAAADARWRETTLAADIAARGLRRPEFHTQALRWPVKDLYTPLDLESIGFDYLRDLGFPGESPFTRGTQANGNRSQLWTMAQVTGFGTGQDWARRARYMLDQGLQGLILEHDLPTTNGYDSDNPLVAGEVGRAGSRDRHAGRHRGRARPALRPAQVPHVGLQRAAAGQPRDDPGRAREQGRRPTLVHAAHGERDPDRVHLRRPLHLPAEARPAHRDRRHRVHDPPSSELDAAVDHQRADLRGARQSGAGARLFDVDRARVHGRGDRARPRRRYARAVLPFRHGRRHGFLRGGLQAARVSQDLGTADQRALRHDAARSRCSCAIMSSPGTMSLTLQQPLNNISRLVDHGARLRAGRRGRDHDDAAARRGACAAGRGRDPRRRRDPACRRARDRARRTRSTRSRARTTSST